MSKFELLLVKFFFYMYYFSSGVGIRKISHYNLNKENKETFGIF